MFIEWSDTGTYHVEQKKENEDAIVSIKDGLDAAIALCDGVSTCEHSRKGSWIACKSLCNFFIRKKSKLANYDHKTIAKKAVAHILYDLKKRADADGDTIESLSSTAACVVYDDEKKKLLCISIGDSLVGGISKQGFEALIKPQKCSTGCYVTTTKGVERVARVLTIDAEKYDAVFICSDGMWKQFYDRGKISNDFKEYLDREEFNLLIDKIRDNKSFDDRSIIVMNLNHQKGATA